MKGRLKGMRAYLIGPMGECGDLGKGWRLDIQKFLWGLRCGVLTPCDKAINVGVEDEELHLKLGKLRELIKYNEICGASFKSMKNADHTSLQLCIWRTLFQKVSHFYVEIFGVYCRGFISVSSREHIRNSKRLKKVNFDRIFEMLWRPQYRF